MSTELNKTTGYRKLGAVILLLIIIVAAFYIGMRYQKTNSELSDPDSNTNATTMLKDVSNSTALPDPLNATYTIEDEKVTLAGGVSGNYHIFGQPVVGDLNGDGQADAISFLYQETSGTGIFFYAVAVVSIPGGYVGTNDVFLGDRIAPQNITIDSAKGTAAVNYATRKDDEPMTAEPSVGVTKYLKVVNGELVEEK